MKATLLAWADLGTELCMPPRCVLPWCMLLLCGLLDTQPVIADVATQSPAIFTGSEVRINDPDLDNVNLAVAFRGAGWTDPDCIPLMVMQTILGTWDKNIGAGTPTPSGFHIKVQCTEVQQPSTKYEHAWHGHACKHVGVDDGLASLSHQHYTALEAMQDSTGSAAGKEHCQACRCRLMVPLPGCDLSRTPPGAA